MNRILLWMFSGLLVLTACSPAAQPPAADSANVETVVAATLQSLTAAAPANGLPVSYNNISLVIPLELNASAAPSISTEVEFPYLNPSNGPMPEHMVFQLTNYPLEGEARIVVFKASDYAAYGAPLQGAVTSLLAGQDAAQPLPDALAQGEFYAQAKQVSFQNGHGVRYITQVLTGFAPINNRDVFYFYQGITNDGAYFVSAVLRIQASFLASDGGANSPVPDGGISFNWSGDLNYPQYLNDVTQKLNGAAAGDFSPPLILLDELIESLKVTNP